MRTYEDFLTRNNKAILIIDAIGRIIFLNHIGGRLLNLIPEKARGSNFFKKLKNTIFPLVLEGISLVDGAAILYLSPKEDLANEKFLAIHQLKAPLASMKWSLELLKNDKNLPIDKLAFIGELYDSNEHLIRLVNDILNVANIESGADDRSRGPQDFERMILEVIELFEPLAAPKNQKIVFEKHTVLGKIRTSQVLFKDTLSNLLDNAISYGAEGSQITISVSLESLGKSYIIAVHNLGLEIMPEEKDKIFQKFYRTEKAKLVKTAGSGLGLYIAKISAERNGGNIWFESGAGGTTFYFSLPNLI
jgi:two-component system phosphate regulon sensor histidine kinase PhoR